MADTDYARGRVAGLNEAVARLALWEKGAVGEEITFAEKAIALVTALLSPVALAGDREAVECTNCGWTGSALKDRKPREHCTECGMSAWSAFRTSDAPAQPAEERAVIEAAMARWEASGVASTQNVRLEIALDVACAALSRARTGSEAQPS